MHHPVSEGIRYLFSFLGLYSLLPLPMKTLLFTAYAIAPEEGSVAGAAWRLIRQLVGRYRVVVVTRSAQAAGVEAFLASKPGRYWQNLRLLSFDLPAGWQQRLPSSLSYYLWQRQVPQFLLAQSLEVDLVHDLDFQHDWTPTWLWRLGKPLVWGPVGVHPLPPRRLLEPVYGRQAWLAEQWRCQRQAWLRWLSPALRRSIREARVTLVSNQAAVAALPVKPRGVVYLPAAGAPVMHLPAPQLRPRFELLCVGPLLPRKGLDLAIGAFAGFYHGLSAQFHPRLRLTVVGEGPARPRLEALVRAHGLQQVVQFAGAQPHSRMGHFYRQAQVLVYPSHVGSSMVPAEAMAYSLPVLCLASTGTAELIGQRGGVAVEPGPYDETIANLADQLRRWFFLPELLVADAEAARIHSLNLLSWEGKARRLIQLYDTLMDEAAGKQSVR
jgi:glycosyltransferase involved in cell wall biosynthesis